MGRDDFTKKTIDTLAERVGYRCSNPACRKGTIGPHTQPDKAMKVGVAAHITAASPGGPRYDPSLSSEQRQAFDNGIWLCVDCSTLIDRDDQRYAVDLLHEWKEQAEQAALDDLEKRPSPLERLATFFAGDTEAQGALRNRQAMLQLVRNTWIKDVLEQSLHGAAMIELSMEEKTDAVERPWEMIVQMPNRPNRTLPKGTRIIDVFDEMNESLLILGEPGSGKTTMLLDLARDTIARAERDPTHPIPAVFNLSSWAAKRGPISEWLVDELRVKYYVAKKVASAWVKDNELLLLLDGLDEVDAKIRNECVTEINAFRKHSTQVVVCSRTADYEVLAARLNLCGAVLLQALTPAQVDEYLKAAELGPVRRAVETDPALGEVAQTPVMLSILILAYRDLPTGTMASAGSVDARQYLFAAYVKSMFRRRGADERYRPGQTVSWLSWLARKMNEQAQTVFLIEGLQPDWLDTRRQLRVFRYGPALFWTLVVGSLLGPVIGLPGTLLLALVIGLYSGLLGFALDRIETVDVLCWSRRKAWKDGVFGLIVGVVPGLVLGLVSGPVRGLVYGLVYGLVVVLVSGLESKSVETTTTPNQGIVQSARNGALCLVVVALVPGLVLGLVYGLVVRLFGGQVIRLVSGLLAGLVHGLLAGLLAGLVSGGHAAIQHYVLRSLLVRSGHMPWHYAHFLDYATERIFLRKVGGGYIFVHRLLQEYYASLDDAAIADLVKTMRHRDAHARPD